MIIGIGSGVSGLLCESCAPTRYKCVLIISFPQLVSGLQPPVLQQDVHRGRNLQRTGSLHNERRLQLHDWLPASELWSLCSELVRVRFPLAFSSCLVLMRVCMCCSDTLTASS